MLLPFNSLYLGFFLASPVLLVNGDETPALSFNSLYLGFFLASERAFLNVLSKLILSIPFTWDFSLHRTKSLREGMASSHLSIPFTWDFSLHRAIANDLGWAIRESFNSLYLGFFLASRNMLSLKCLTCWTFNSLYLGFFLASGVIQ